MQLKDIILLSPSVDRLKKEAYTMVFKSKFRKKRGEQRRNRNKRMNGSNINFAITNESVSVIAGLLSRKVQAFNSLTQVGYILRAELNQLLYFSLIFIWTCGAHNAPQRMANVLGATM